MMKEQNDAQSGSDFNDTRYYERKHTNTLPRSFRYRDVNSQVPRTRVKFDSKAGHSRMPNGAGKEVPRKREYYQPAPSATSDSEYESVLNCQYLDLDDNSEHESLFDPNDDVSRTFNEMESKMNATTNHYFHKIKSQLNETCSKLKVHQKHKPRGKAEEKGAGDFKSVPQPSTPENDAVIDRIMKLKSDCYKKIDQNLKILQKIDQVNDKLYKNYIASASKIN